LSVALPVYRQALSANSALCVGNDLHRNASHPVRVGAFSDSLSAWVNRQDAGQCMAMALSHTNGVAQAAPWLPYTVRKGPFSPPEPSGRVESKTKFSIKSYLINYLHAKAGNF
jgi:hypothetical protein